MSIFSIFAVGMMLLVVYLVMDSIKLDKACREKGGIYYRGECIKVEKIKL
jgi:hypothetical protein